MTGYGSNRFVVSFGEQFLSDKITLTGTSGTNTVTTGATLTVSKYAGMRMFVLGTGTNAGKIYHVVDNAAGTITLQEANTGFTTDTVIFEQRFKRCDELTQLQSGGDAYDRNVFLNQCEDLEFFTPTPNTEELYSLSGGQDRSAIVTKTFAYTMPVNIVVQNFRFPYTVFGYELCTGTPGTMAETLSTATKPGECQIVVSGVTGLAAGDYLCIGYNGEYPEVRRAMNATSPIRLDRPLKFAHGTGASENQVKEVVAPFTHYLLTSERIQTGTDVTSGGGSTLNGATNPFATSITVGAATDYAVGDYIQIGDPVLGTPTDAKPEIRRITAISGTTFTLDAPLRFAHANSVNCNEVTQPFTSTVTEFAEVPGLNIHGTYTDATNFVRDAEWCKLNTGEFSSELGELLRFSADVIGCKVDTSGTKATVAVPGTTPYQFRHVSGGITVNGVQYANIESFRYRIERAIQTVYTHSSISGANPFTLIEGKRRHELGMTIIPMNSNFYTLLDGTTLFNVSLTYNRGSNDTATFYFHDVLLSAAPHGMVIDGPVRVSATMNPAWLLFVKVVDTIPCYPHGVIM